MQFRFTSLVLVLGFLLVAVAGPSLLAQEAASVQITITGGAQPDVRVKPKKVKLCPTAPSASCPSEIVFSVDTAALAGRVIEIKRLSTSGVCFADEPFVLNADSSSVSSGAATASCSNGKWEYGVLLKDGDRVVALNDDPSVLVD